MIKFYRIALCFVMSAAPIKVFAQDTTTGTASNCLVQDAAKAAVQKQIALIDGAKVDPSDFFNGANSCISPDLMKQFDISNLIPDLSGMLTSGATDMLTNLLNNAKQKMCDVLNQQLQQTVSRINSNMMSFQGLQSGQLSGLLNGSVTNISLPNIPGIGTFRLSSLGLGSISAVPLPQPAIQTYSASPAPTVVRPPTQSTPATQEITPSEPSAPTSVFGNIFQ